MFLGDSCSRWISLFALLGFVFLLYLTIRFADRLVPLDGAAVKFHQGLLAGTQSLVTDNRTEDVPRGEQNAKQSPTAEQSAIEIPRGEKVYRLEVVNRYPHDPYAFTQGLLYLGNDTFYESTGLYGKSTVRKVDLKTGKVLLKTANNGKDFGEGLAYYKGSFWQLIWKTHTVYQYDPRTMALIGTHASPREVDYTDGWGLASTSDGVAHLYNPGEVPQDEALYLTDSGTKLYHLEFINGRFKVLNANVIRTPEGQPLMMTNELELIADDDLWANVYGMDCIARVDPRTGKVFGWILADHLKRERGRRGDVFNGIAYDRRLKRLFVTGKQWETIFEVKLVPERALSAGEVRRLCVPSGNIFHR